MNIGTKLLISFLLASIGLAIGTLIVVGVDPNAADSLTKGAFFGVVFLTLSGFSVPIIFWSRVQAGNREIIAGHFPIAVRHAVLLSALATALLLLQAIRALSWWDALLVVAGAGFIELAMRSRT
jgi:hypothetical protein